MSLPFICKKTMNWKISLIYGTISGVIIVSSFFIGFYITDGNANSTGELVGYATMLLAFSAVFIGLKNHRDKSLGGIMSFKQAFSVGLGIVLVASVIYVIGWMIYQPIFAPDFADKWYSGQIELVKANAELTDQEKQVQISSMEASLENYKKPHIMAAYTFMEIFPVGLLVTLIASLFLKKKPPS